jgi:hypothetical protein
MFIPQLKGIMSLFVGRIWFCVDIAAIFKPNAPQEEGVIFWEIKINLHEKSLFCARTCSH